MKADLHIHSTYSDGTMTIREIAKRAITKGLDIITITDHDNVSSHEEIKNNDYDIKIIPGIELSTVHSGEAIHILGYFKNTDDALKIKLELDELAEKRKQRVNTIIELLRQYYNIEIKYEDVVKYADGVVARPHIAKAITEKYGYEREEVFQKFIGDTCKAYIPVDNLETSEGIKILHQVNALVILAHPILIKKNNISNLLDLGFDGIESYYPEHDEKDTKRYKDIAAKKNLIVTGGSDFHGVSEKSDIATSILEEKGLDVFLKKLNGEYCYTKKGGYYD